MIRQIPERSFSGPALTEGACLFKTPDTMLLEQPIEWDRCEDDGLGPAKTALFEIDDGPLFLLQYHELSPRRDLTTLFVSPGDIASHVDAALTELGLSSVDLGWLPPGVSLRPARLIRQDDNGVAFHIGDFPCRADAEAVVARLSVGGHKQTYFIDPIASDFPRLRFPENFGSPPTILNE